MWGGSGAALTGRVRRRYDAAMPAAKGDVVEIVNDKDAEWWLCRLRGKQGFIPASFIERVSSDREAYQKSGVRFPVDPLPSSVRRSP